VNDPVDALRRARTALRKLEREARDFLRNEGFRKAQQRFEHRLDVRYVGQAYNLSVPAESQFLATFHRAHEQAYGHADPQRPVEIVNVRCRAIGISPRIELPKIASVRPGTRTMANAVANSFLSGKSREAPIYEREVLCHGHEFAGPAIITEYSATSLVPANWRARVDAYGQIHLSLAGKSQRRHGR